MSASLNDTVVTGTGASVTDAKGNVWAINSSGQITVNGKIDTTTGNVDELAYYNGVVWQKNAANAWYSKSSPSASWVQWTQAGAPVPIPNTSANDTTVAAGSTARIVDANGNAWGLTASGGGSGYQVTVDGSVDSTTGNVVQLAIVNGTVWQENTAGMWYAKTSPASTWSAGTTIDPLTGSAQPVTLTWAGGGSNLASSAADWSPAVAPSAGESLVMNNGTMNLSGNALAGDTLTVGAGATVTINATATSSLNLSTTSPGANITVDVAASSTLSLNAHVTSANLNVTGGTVAFIGTNSFNAFNTVLTANLTGNATLNLFGGNATGQDMVVNGSVAAGLNFNISSNGAGDSGLQIDHPASFAGAITLQQAGFVAFMGIQATQGALLNGVLDLYNGSTLVASARVADTAPAAAGALQLQQNASGVMLSLGIGDYSQPSGVGSALTLHT